MEAFKVPLNFGKSLYFGYKTTEGFGITQAAQVGLSLWAAKNAYTIGSLLYSQETSPEKYIKPALGVAIPVALFVYLRNSTKVERAVAQVDQKVTEIGVKVTEIDVKVTELSDTLKDVKNGQDAITETLKTHGLTLGKQTEKLDAIGVEQKNQTSVINEVKAELRELYKDHQATAQLITELKSAQQRTATAHSEKLEALIKNHETQTQVLNTLKVQLDEVQKVHTEQQRALIERMQKIEAEQQKQAATLNLIQTGQLQADSRLTAFGNQIMALGAQLSDLQKRQEQNQRELLTAINASFQNTNASVGAAVRNSLAESGLAGLLLLPEPATQSKEKALQTNSTILKPNPLLTIPTFPTTFDNQLSKLTLGKKTDDLQ